MRCKKCGGILHHFVTTIKGEVIRRCHTGIMSLHEAGYGHRMTICGATYDEVGKEAQIGRTFAVRSEGNIKIATVQ